VFPEAISTMTLFETTFISTWWYWFFEFPLAIEV